METLHAVVLALIQGLTEFLPISSSAHLILVPSLLGWEDQGLAFDVAAHVGSLIAVLFFLRRELCELGSAWARSLAPGGDRTTPAARLAWAVLLGTIPVAVVGFFAGEQVERHLRSLPVIAVANLVFALPLLAADRWGRKTRQEGQLSLGAAVLIGCAQVFALVPGVSRSGVTITAGLALGLTARAAARFSFLLAVPVIALAGAAEGQALLASAAPIDWWRFAIALVVAGVSALLCMHAFLALVTRIGLWPFVVYRLALGGVLLALFASAG